MDLLASTIVLLATPIPVVHFVFHAFLGTWRRRPSAFYLVALLLWAVSATTLWSLPVTAPLVAPTAVMQSMGAAFVFVGTVLVLWAIVTIHPRRFFLWAVLRLESMPQVRILRGPYRLLVHPAYVGYQLIAFGAFLGSGMIEALALTGWLLVAMPVLIRIEERELADRVERRAS